MAVSCVALLLTSCGPGGEKVRAAQGQAKLNMQSLQWSQWNYMGQRKRIIDDFGVYAESIDELIASGILDAHRAPQEGSPYTFTMTVSEDGKSFEVSAVADHKNYESYYIADRGKIRFATDGAIANAQSPEVGDAKNVIVIVE